MDRQSSNYLGTLHRLLNEYFSSDEIDDLCFQLNIDHESLPDKGKPSRIRELILVLGRKDRLGELIILVQKQRPNVHWPSVPSDFKLPEMIGTTSENNVPLLHTTLNNDDSQRAARNRRAILELVKNIWIKGVLESSLHGEHAIELGLEKLGDVVEQPWENAARLHGHSKHRLSEGTRVVDAFDEVNHALLILGVPGAGKTIMLLKLTDALLLRAERDASHPIPVVFTLSSWRDKDLSLEQWIIDELNSKYKVPVMLGREWIESGDLALMLEGLDEISKEYRESCVEAINTFRRQHGLTQIAVTSRVADYGELGTRLELNGAISIQQLTFGQVENILRRSGANYEKALTLLQEDVSLQELIKTPLMLSILIWAYNDSANFKLPDSIDGQRNFLFATYVQRMLAYYNDEQSFSNSEIIHYLSQLANKMSQKSRTIFMLEEIQPDWLESEHLKKKYAFIVVMVVSILIGVGLTGVVGIFEWVANYNVVLGIICSIIAGFLFSRLMVDYSLLSSAAPPPSGLKKNRRVRVLGSIVKVGYSAAIVAFLFFTLVISNHSGWSTGLLIGAHASLLFGLSFGLIFGSSNPIYRGVNPVFNIRPVESLNWSWKPMVKQILRTFWDLFLMGLPFLVPMCCLWILFNSLYLNSPTRLFRLTTDILYIPLTLWFTLGFYLPLLLGLREGLAFSSLDAKTYSNQGMWESAKNASRALLFFFITFGLVGGLNSSIGSSVNLLFYSPCDWSSEFECLLPYWSTYFFVSALSYGLFGGIIGGLWFGGYTIIQHLVLRVILNTNRLMPIRATDFFDLCAQVQLIQKVGAGYMFRHHLLLDYLSNQRVPDDELQLTSNQIKLHKNFDFLIELVKKIQIRWVIISMCLVFAFAFIAYVSRDSYRRILAITYARQAIAYTITGDFPRTMDRLEKAIIFDPENIADYRNSQCWFGSILGKAAEVMKFCDEAIAIESSPSNLDSRGFARAMIGDYEGAISDFRLSANFISCREFWIEELEKGTNPINVSVLDKLQKNPLLSGC